jgi:hypothetical protein
MDHSTQSFNPHPAIPLGYEDYLKHTPCFEGKTSHRSLIVGQTHAKIENKCY